MERSAASTRIDRRVLEVLEHYFELKLDDGHSLLREVESMHLAGGEWLMHQGDPGDAFYLLIDGTVEVDRDGAHVDDMAAGDSFGEVALISGEPRNATVTAGDECRAYRLECAPFLSAVTGNPYSRAAADRVAAERG